MVTLQSAAQAVKAIITTLGNLANAAGALTNDGSGNLSWAAAGGITLGTPQTTTSGTSKTFSGIPSTAKQVMINFAGVSLSGTGVPIVQLGDAGGIEVTGYVGDMQTGTTTASYSASFQLATTSAASSIYTGTMTLTLENSTNNTWALSGVISRTGSVWSLAGTKSLSPGPLTQIQIGSTTGTDTFDAGELNISYQ